MISRRGFLGMLAGLAVEPVARKVYAFAPPQGWTSGEGMIYTPEATVSARELDFIITMLADNVFKTSPLLTRLGGDQ